MFIFTLIHTYTSIYSVDKNVKTAYIQYIQYICTVYVFEWLFLVHRSKPRSLQRGNSFNEGRSLKKQNSPTKCVSSKFLFFHITLSISLFAKLPFCLSFIYISRLKFRIVSMCVLAELERVF